MTARDTILSACRKNAFVKRGSWGMRTDVSMGGFAGRESERVPRVVLDLERTVSHPTKLGFDLPLVLASGPTWEAVLEQLVAEGELLTVSR